MDPEGILGFTIRLVYKNYIFTCTYDHFETKINLLLCEQMFVYLLLAAAAQQHAVNYISNRAINTAHISIKRRYHSKII